MGRFSRYARVLGREIVSRALKIAGSSLKEPSAWVQRWFGGHSSKAGITVTPETALQHNAVMACVRLLSGCVAALPLKIHRRLPNGRREEAENHPLYAIVKVAGNDHQTAFEMRQMLMVHLLLRGNAYAFIDRTVAGVIKGLKLLHPDQVEFRIFDDGTIVYEYRRRNGAVVSFRPDEILHLKGMTLDGHTGVSVITYARESIGIALAYDEYAGNFVANGTQMGGVITSPRPANAQVRKNIKASFDEIKGEGAGGNVFLDEGMTYTKLGLTLQDAQFLEQKKFSVTDICRIFQVPPHLAGDLERATFSNIENQDRSFLKYSLGPWLTSIEQRMALSLLRPHERLAYYFHHNRDAFLEGDSLTQARVHQIHLANGIKNPNEIRADYNLNPRSDEGGEEYFRPGNLMPEASDLDPKQTNLEKDADK